LSSWSIAPIHAARVMKYIYREGAGSAQEMSELPASLRRRLAEEFSWDDLEQCSEAVSSDGFTRKLLLGMADGQRVEAVLMQFRGRWTACVSSQVGCAMGCVFCATAQMGLVRQLTTGEIVQQVVHANRLLHQPGLALRNVVLMGMGEPLHNYDAVMKAVAILCEPTGLALAPRHITLSTVGVIPGIVRLADERQRVNLAISLHAATQEERAKLVPPARAWPLDELMAACRYYAGKLQRRIFFEWALIDGQNDSAEHAAALGQLLDGLPSHVNLIPLNPIAGYDGVPTPPASAKRFQAILAAHVIPSTIRQRRGIDIAAGCGQLAARNVPKPEAACLGD
ncbi:MAG TPA: 23S rRNA (adenine(2503)-C(2))-methyltransferase RlmN, partial [Pirellulaceae bacterium]|nr:23S rRNA (adenine(2503)-C(2))-methyltransferase RlmN [Pirellulaceae bacterium]